MAADCIALSVTGPVAGLWTVVLAGGCEDVLSRFIGLPVTLLTEAWTALGAVLA